MPIAAIDRLSQTDGAVLTIDDQNFAELVLRAELPVLVDFGAVWCPPCRTLAPHVHALAAAHAGRLRVGVCDTDESRALAAELDIRSLPTLLLFQHGRVTGQLVGAVSRARLESFVAGAINRADGPLPPSPA